MIDLTQDDGDSEPAEHLFIEFASDVLDWLQKHVSSGDIDIPRVPREYIHFTPNSYREVVGDSVDYGEALIKGFHASLSSLPSARRCAERLIRNKTLPSLADYRKHQDALEGKARITEDVELESLLVSVLATYSSPVAELFTAIADLLSRCQSLQPPESSVIAAYKRFVSYRTATHLLYENTVLLQNFRTDVPHMEIGQSLDLQAFTPDDKTELWNTYGRNLNVGFHQFGEASFKLVARHWVRRWKELPITHMMLGDVRRVLTALRLLKPGDVGAQFVYAIMHLTPFSANIGALPLFGCRTRQFGSCEYELQRAEVPQLLVLYETLDALEQQRKPGGLDVALRRFNQSYERDTGEDRIIDLTIALESCLLTGIQDELRYRLALRGAALLSDTADPAYTQSQLETIYDIRSKIVHEGLRLSDKTIAKRLDKMEPSIEAHEWPDSCQDIVRAVLREYVRRLSEDKDVRTVNSELDMRIVGGLARMQ